MAFYLQTTFICVLFLAFLSTSFSFPGSGDLIDEICDRIPDKRPLCVEVLKSDPRSSAQNIANFAIIAVDAALKNATCLVSYVKTLAKQTTDPQVKYTILGCVTNVEDALSNITKANSLVEAKQYDLADEKNDLAKNALSTCDNSFLLPYVEPVELKQATKVLKDLVGISTVINR